MTFGDIYLWVYGAFTIIYIFWLTTKPNVPFKQYSNPPILEFIIAIIAILLIGFTPVINQEGDDRTIYANTFNNFLYDGMEIPEDQKDQFFYGYQKLSSSFLPNYTWWFIITAIIYVANYFISCLKTFKQLAFPALLMVFISFGFYGYGVNTIRAGLALSFIVLAIFNYRNFYVFIPALIIAYFIHNSTGIPIIALILSRLFNKTFVYFILWFIAIGVSFVAGNYFNLLFEDLVIDNRASYFTDINENYKQGFRWDFVIYSLIPLVIGYYYIFVKHFKSQLYALIYNTYILANIVWVLVIRANFTDRFAYLSWFLIPFILIYPLLKGKIFYNQKKILGITLFGELAFLFLLYFRGIQH